MLSRQQTAGYFLQYSETIATLPFQKLPGKYPEVPMAGSIAYWLLSLSCLNQTR